MKPINRIILSVVLAMAICQLSFWVIKKGIDKYESYDIGRLKELLYNNTAYDMLFLGSSRTHLTIDPQIIDSICKTNSYNAGIEGANVFEFNMMLEAYLENHPAPKWLILTLDLHSFASGKKFFNYTQYFSFTKNSVIKKYLNENGYNTLRLAIFPFLEMTDYDDNTKGYFLKGFIGKTGMAPGDFQYKGYSSNTNNYITSDETAQPEGPMQVSDTAKAYLQDIIQTCYKNSIKLIFTYAPEYKHLAEQSHSNSGEILDMINKVAKNNNIPYLRDDSLYICTNPKLFANIGHLNRVGGIIYSGILGNELKEILNK